MVHHANVAYILEHGMYTQKSPKADPNYISIGDTKLIQDRQVYKLKVKNGRSLGEYIPFYFAGHSPMLYNIKTGYRGITKRKQEDIIFIVCEVQDIVGSCPEWVFTDGHAKNTITRFYTDIGEISSLDWSIIKSRYWSNTEEDYDIMRKKQAEFLVYKHVPVTCIKGLVVKNTSKEFEIAKIVRKLDLSIKIYIDTNCKYYYP